MDSKDELKEIKNCTCHDFDDIIRNFDIDFDSISLDEKSYKDKCENILVYNISYETFISVKPLRISFDKIGGKK